jgi:hypothetical protein
MHRAKLEIPLDFIVILALLLFASGGANSQGKPATAGIFEARVGVADDDAEELRDGRVSRSSSDLQLTLVPGGHQTVGIRWDDVSVPRGAIITSAWVQFQVAEDDLGPADLVIHGELAANADAFHGLGYNISQRPTTTTSVDWQPPPWPTPGAQGPDQHTPDVAAVIEEVVGQDGWYSGNALVLVFTGTGTRTAVSYERDPSAAPLLHIEYTPVVTPAPLEGSVTIVAAGDIACDPRSRDFNDGRGTPTDCRQLHVANLILSIDPDAVLSLGDTQYQSGTLEQFRESYHPSWGRLFDITYPIVGDHEYLETGAQGYFEYFGARAGDPEKGYYSFDLGSWHLIALNSNCKDADGCGAGSPQERWLRDDLAASTAKCTLAYWHHPRYSSGDHGDNPSTSDLWRALYEAGAEIVLSGDDHHYERFQPAGPEGNPDPDGGIRSWVVGTGGDSNHTTGLDRPVELSELRNGEVFGVLRLLLYPGGYEWTFVKESGPSFRDVGSGSCH